MRNFEYYNPARIIFGRGEEKQAGPEAARFGKRILLHYGGGSIKRNGVYDAVVASLKKEGLFFVELGGVQPNPRLSLVREGMKICRDNGIDFILAVGGGSVIDSAKAIAAAMTNGRDVWDYYMDGSLAIDSALPVGVVLTIPAAGSESSTGSVITNEQTGYKRAIDSEYLIPRFAIMDPESTFTMPREQIAYGCSDIIAHLMERYFTREKHVDFTDRMIEANLRTILVNGPGAMKNPTDYDVRAEVMWAGTVAHNNLLDTGRVGDWASHNIEHELSGMYDIAHGAGLSIIFPAWMKYVYGADIDKFVQFAQRVFDVEFAFDDRERIVFEMIERLEQWYRRMGLPVRLSDVGIGDDKLKVMAKMCLDGREKYGVGHFKRLNEEDVYNIYRLAL